MVKSPQTQTRFTEQDAKQLGKELNIDFETIPISEFLKGINVETEHGSANEDTNVTRDIDILVAKIALAHLRHVPDYYSRLEKMMHEAYSHWYPR